MECKLDERLALIASVDFQFTCGLGVAARPLNQHESRARVRLIRTDVTRTDVTRTDVTLAKSGCICYAARVNDSEFNKPLGKTLRRKEIGSFVFVHHDYPSQAARDTHWHPWLHLMIVCRGLYSRKVGRQSFDYKTGMLLGRNASMWSYLRTQKKR